MKLPKVESKTVEFKSTFNQDVIVSLVAFANADGGDVYVGVRDDGKVVGVQLASLFKAVGLTERYGSGIKRIEDACRRHGGVRVEFENHDTWFKVVLSKVDDGGSEMLGDGSLKSSLKSSLKILKILKDDSQCTYDALAAILGISRRAVTKQIGKLRKEGRLRRVGPDKGGHWEVIEKMES